MVQEWVTQGMKRSIDNAQRPGRGSMMRPTINEESDCLRKKNLRRRTTSTTYGQKIYRFMFQRIKFLQNVIRNKSEDKRRHVGCGEQQILVYFKLK